MNLSAPDIGQPLEELGDPIIVSAQSVPAQREVGGVQRVLSLDDRVWLKVKTGSRRAIVTQLRGADLSEDLSHGVNTWWIGAAGRRQDDSPQHDFYASIERECTTGKTVSTGRLLPGEWDWDRLTAERVLAWRREMKQLVIRMIIESLKTGKVAMIEFRDHRIMALVRADDGHEAYLAIIADGIPDQRVFALLLDCVPGIAPGDWQPEPSPLAEMEPLPGQIIWSTIFPSQVASALLDLDADGAG